MDESSAQQNGNLKGLDEGFCVKAGIGGLQVPKNIDT